MKHHHIVMTLPFKLRSLRYSNENTLYGILFKASSLTLKKWFKQKHGLIPGIISVLHTSGSDLKIHPHVHMIVSAGGLEISNYEVKELKAKFLEEQRIIADRFRSTMTKMLIAAHRKGKFIYNSYWTQDNFENHIKKLKEKQWIVNIEEPLDDLQMIVKYVGRYTKRACMSEYKIKSIEKGIIKFKYNDYKNTPRGEKAKESISSQNYIEFLDKLLEHVPNKHFRMVRYSGAYTSHFKKYIPEFELKYSYEEVELTEEWGEFETYRKRQIQFNKRDPLICPKCNNRMSKMTKEQIRKNYYDDS